MIIYRAVLLEEPLLEKATQQEYQPSDSFAGNTDFEQRIIISLCWRDVLEKEWGLHLDIVYFVWIDRLGMT